MFFRSPPYGGSFTLYRVFQVISIVHLFIIQPCTQICILSSIFSDSLWTVVIETTVQSSDWDHCSEVFSTLMRPGKLMLCIQCDGGSFSLRYFCILIIFIRVWSLSSLLESLGRSPKSPGCLLDWYLSGPRRVTSSDLSPPLFPYVTIYSRVSPVIYSSSDTSSLANKT